MTTHETVVDFS